MFSFYIFISKLYEVWASSNRPDLGALSMVQRDDINRLAVEMDYSVLRVQHHLVAVQPPPGCSKSTFLVFGVLQFMNLTERLSCEQRFYMKTMT